MRVCGIDPGMDGAICVLDSQNPAHIALIDIKKHAIFELAHWLHNQQISVVYLEDVHSLYGMSAKSNFSFGRNLGVVMTIAQIVTEGKPTEYVTAKVWQKFIGVTSKGKAIKNDVAQLALSLYPQAQLYGPKGGLRDGRADALMITHYGLQKELSS
jgi:Holliday junction resolvasome RuvABC endonuclease subunit